ncbi:MAG: VOC family protein [Planctomycetota bacterium]|nr:VOC family protein [Planctomycetota bacterium]
MLTPDSVYETVLYGDDVPALVDFYSRVIGLRTLPGADGDSAALRFPVGDSLLLLFRPDYAAIEGRGVPTHGARGPGHVAFRVGAGMLDRWRERLGQLNVTIELERPWTRGGRSIYLRDPAGNSVELVEGAIWAP